MVCVDTGQIVDMQRGHRVVHEALEKFFDQIDIELADPRARKNQH